MRIPEVGRLNTQFDLANPGNSKVSAVFSTMFLAPFLPQAGFLQGCSSWIGWAVLSSTRGPPRRECAFVPISSAGILFALIGPALVRHNP
jgi:hypothetical protein